MPTLGVIVPGIPGAGVMPGVKGEKSKASLGVAGIPMRPPTSAGVEGMSNGTPGGLAVPGAGATAANASLGVPGTP